MRTLKNSLPGIHRLVVAFIIVIIHSTSAQANQTSPGMQQVLKAKLYVEETGIIQRMAQGPALNYVENMTDFTVEIEKVTVDLDVGGDTVAYRFRELSDDVNTKWSARLYIKWFTKSTKPVYAIDPDFPENRVYPYLNIISILRLEAGSNGQKRWTATVKRPSGLYKAQHSYVTQATSTSLTPPRRVNRLIQSSPGSKYIHWDHEDRYLEVQEKAFFQFVTKNTVRVLDEIQISGTAKSYQNGSLRAQSDYKLAALIKGQSRLPETSLTVLRSESQRAFSRGSYRLNDTSSLPKMLKARAKKNLDGQSIKELLVIVDSMATGPEDMQKKALVTSALAAWFKLTPGDCQRLTNHWTTLKSTDPRMSIWAGALSLAENPACEKAFTDWFELKKNDGEALSFFALQIPSFPKPSIEMVERLKRLTQGNTNTKLAALFEMSFGGLLHSFAAHNQTEAERYVRILEERLAKTSDPIRITTLLGAVGNAGLVSTLPTVVKYTRHPEEHVRARAFWALRAIDSPRVPEILAKAFEADKSNFVQAYAIDAALERKLDPRMVRSIQDKIVKKETDPSLTIRGIKYIYRLRYIDSTVPTMIEQIGSQTSDAELKKVSMLLLKEFEDELAAQVEVVKDKKVTPQ